MSKKENKVRDKDVVLQKAHKIRQKANELEKNKNFLESRELYKRARLLYQNLTDKGAVYRCDTKIFYCDLNLLDKVVDEKEIKALEEKGLQLYPEYIDETDLAAFYNVKGIFYRINYLFLSSNEVFQKGIDLLSETNPQHIIPLAHLYHNRSENFMNMKSPYDAVSSALKALSLLKKPEIQTEKNGGA